MQIQQEKENEKNEKISTKCTNHKIGKKKHWYRVIYVFTLNKVWKNML